MLLFRWVLSHLTWFSVLLLTLYGLYTYLPKFLPLLVEDNNSAQNSNKDIELTNQPKYKAANKVKSNDELIKNNLIKKRSNPVDSQVKQLPEETNKKVHKQTIKQINSPKLDVNQKEQSTKVFVQEKPEVDSKIPQQAIYQFQKKGYNDLQDMLKMLKQQK